jgi:hypothetical protein
MTGHEVASLLIEHPAQRNFLRFWIVWMPDAALARFWFCPCPQYFLTQLVLYKLQACIFFYTDFIHNIDTIYLIYLTGKKKSEQEQTRKTG